MPKYAEFHKELHFRDEEAEPVSAPLADRYLIELLVTWITPITSYSSRLFDLLNTHSIMICTPRAKPHWNAEASEMVFIYRKVVSFQQFKFFWGEFPFKNLSVL